MAKAVVTSSGRYIDLDSGNEVQDLPPEGIQIEKRSYGSHDSPTFSISLKNHVYNLRCDSDDDQWYCNTNGRMKLVREVKEMNLFPFDVFLKQNTDSGDISYLTIIRVNGVEHDVLLTYDYDHPDCEMEAVVLRPTLDMKRMSGHSYGQNRPCYIENWRRKFRAIHVAMQVTSWLNDYYKGTYSYGQNVQNFSDDLQRLLNESRKLTFEGRYW